MIFARAPDRITSWSVAFFEGGHYRFARWVPGRFKHCLAFGYSEPCRTWVVFDVAWRESRIYVLPDGAWGAAQLAELLDGATILKPAGGSQAVLLSSRLAFYCVPAVAHLLGCGAALTPTGFYRRLIAAGAEVIHGERQPAACPGRAA